MKILFVCKANVFRSQVAEALLRKTGNYEVKSAGTLVSEKGMDGRKVMEWTAPSIKALIKAAKDAELDIEENSTNQVTQEMVGWADKIIIMAQKELVPRELLNNKKSVWWDVQDGTDYSDYEFFASSIKEIKVKILKLIDELRN